MCTVNSIFIVMHICAYLFEVTPKSNSIMSCLEDEVFVFCGSLKKWRRTRVWRSEDAAKRRFWGTFGSRVRQTVVEINPQSWGQPAKILSADKEVCRYRSERAVCAAAIASIEQQANAPGCRPILGLMGPDFL